MAPDLIPHIFDLFTQGDHTPERAHGGLGIGLTLVRRLAELHGGTVEARSEGIGKGSEFIVRVPLAANGHSNATDEALPSLPRRAEKPRRVLLVDDNVDAATSLRRVLSAIGHRVSAAHSGLEALRMAEESPPEVILCDIGLPDLDGYQVAARVREMPQVKEAVLVAVTGYGQDEDRRKARLAGFDYHLVKPVDPCALQEILDESAGPR
jgi:CheY-like chemotaxis protein